jgi:hypothetical protein
LGLETATRVPGGAWSEPIRSVATGVPAEAAGFFGIWRISSGGSCPSVDNRRRACVVLNASPSRGGVVMSDRNDEGDEFGLLSRTLGGLPEWFR